MNRNNYPTEVTIVVYSVKNIKSKKKDPKYCVIFSIGSVKYRTDLIQDPTGNPVFDTESALQVENPKHPLTLVVTEKKEKEFFGQLVIPLEDLELTKSGQVYKRPLEPHKKCSKPTAEIHFEAWISNVLVSSSLIPDIQVIEHPITAPTKKSQLSSFKKTLASLVGSPKISRKFSDKKNKGSDWSVNSQAGAKPYSSCFDLSRPAGFNTLPTYNNSFVSNNNNNITKRLENDFEKDKIDTIEETEENNLPEISGISPNSGPVYGGTKITIRGKNLGQNREDIVGLFVCGSNILGSLEYVSSFKILCITKPWKPGDGIITMETQSGGKSTSSVKFAFVGDDTTSVGEAPDLDPSSSVRRAESLKDSQKSPNKVSLFGSPKLVHKSFFSSKLFLDPKGLGIPASKSMLDLSGHHGSEDSKKDSKNYLKKSFLGSQSNLNTDVANQKNANTLKCPPIIHIQPMRFQQHDLTLKSNKSMPNDFVYMKDLENQLLDYKTISSELRVKAQELENENQRLKEYIGKLVSQIMIKCPELLCSDS